MSNIARRTRVIGVVPPSITRNMVAIAYSQGCINGLINRAGESGSEILLFLSADQSRDPDHVVRQIDSSGCDGVVLIAPPRDGHIVAALKALQIPFTIMSMQFPGATCVTVDNVGGVILAVDHLVRLGHTRIAHIYGDDRANDSIQRRDTFLARMEHHGLPVPNGYLQCGNFVIPDAYVAMQALIWHTVRPTAVFCANDESAVAAIRAAWESGLRVPGDVSIVGFDDSVLCEAAIPTITSVRQPWIEMGECAFDLLLKKLEGGSPANRVFPAELVVRSSTSSPDEDKFLADFVQ